MIIHEPYKKGMTLREIAVSHGRITRITSRPRLLKLGQECIDENIKQIQNNAKNGFDDIIIHGQLKHSFNGSTNWKGNQIEIHIGIGMAELGCPIYQYTKAGYVFAIHEIFHENRHAQQYAMAWCDKQFINDRNNPEENEIMKNLLRRQLIMPFFNTAYTTNYKNDPSEMDAEYYALKRDLEYFKNDKDPFVSEKEALQILFEVMASIDYGHYEKFEDKSVRDIQDIIEIFGSERASSVHVGYTVSKSPNFLQGLFPPSEYDLTLKMYEPENKPFLDVINAEQDGMIQDKLLEQPIMTYYPDTINLYPSLYWELRQCSHDLDEIRTKSDKKWVEPDKMHYLILNPLESSLAALETDKSLKL